MQHSIKKYFLFLIVSASAFSATAQQGWWTWMHGTQGVVSGNYGVQGVAAPTNEPPAMYKTDACWTDSNGKFWFYGGDLGASALWKYDPVTNQWTWMKGPNTYGVPAVYGTKGVPAAANNPPVVSTGSALTWIDASDNLWLWGGGISILGTSADMWKYTPATNMWTWMHGPGVATTVGSYGVQGVSSATNLPPPRYETSASWVDNAGNFWMFGGGVSTGQINDMWKYNPVINEWTWMKGPQTAGNIAGNYGVKGVAAATNLPPCRWPYCRWTDNSGNFWMFGGTGVNNNTDSYNDMWKFDPLTNNWTWVSGSNLTNQTPAFPAKCVPSSTNYPQGRYENSLAWKDKCGNLWMYSGQWTAAQGSQDKSDVWCYKPATNEWIFVGGNVAASSGSKGVSAGSNFPGNSYGAGAFVSNNEFYYFGGRSSGPNGNLLWRYVPDSACAQSFCYPQPTSPTANFNGSNLIGCAPLTSNFTNTSTNATSWTWNFGDGSPSSNVQNPTHTYPNPGNYTVTLIVSNGTTNDTLTYTNYVNVIAPAVASFTLPNDTVCVGQNVTITNTSTNSISQTWWMGNLTLGSIVKGDTNTNFNYTFTIPGMYTVILMADSQFGCNGMDSIHIYVVNASNVTQNITICAGKTFTLPDGSQTGVAGTYLDTIGLGSCDSIITTVLTVNPAGSITQSPIICTGNIFTLPDGSPATVAGTYLDTVQTTNGCDSIITTILSVVSSFTSSQSPVICAGNSFTLPDGITAAITGTYLDTIPSAGGCDSIITTNLTVNAAFTGSQSAVLCTGNSFTLPTGLVVTANGTYTDTVNALNGCDSIVTSVVTFNPNSSSTQSVVICSDTSYTLTDGTVVTASGIYKDTISSFNGCDSLITVTLSVNPIPIIGISPDITIIQGQSTVLTTSGGGTYNWSPSVGLDTTTTNPVIASPTVTTIYCVEVVNISGCKDTACVTVRVEVPCPKSENLTVPNAFSPNNDVVNDEFCLQGWENCIQNFSIRIYDRWGEKVFESSDPSFCWDGKYKGKQMDSAVFIYYLKASFTDQSSGIIKKGNISLIR